MMPRKQRNGWAEGIQPNKNQLNGRTLLCSSLTQKPQPPLCFNFLLLLSSTPEIFFSFLLSLSLLSLSSSSMDVSLSAKPQILTLISCTPLSSSSSSSSRTIRREFLGCGHNLRPPGGLRYRRRSRKSSSSHSHSSRFLFRAALGSHSVLVVVAVVTVSAASIVYWNLFRPKKNSREVSTQFKLNFYY